MSAKVFQFNEDFAGDLAWQESEDQHSRLVGVYSPSELVYPCLRSIALRYRFPDKKISEASTLYAFEMGKLLERWFVGRLACSEQWKLLGTQDSIKVRTPGGQILSGLRDARIKDRRTDLVYSVEVKTGSGNPAYWPKPEHLAQANFYLRDGLPGLVVYVSPFLQVHTFPQTFAPELYQRMISRAYELDAYLVAGTLPAPEPQHWGKKICQYCSFRLECGR